MIIYPNHPVSSDIMMQVVLKSYGYYEGKLMEYLVMYQKKH